MKKAIVLGVLAFFAINIASVQNANAQDKKKVTTKEAVEIKDDTQKQKATIKSEKRENILRSASTSIQQDRKNKKTDKKDVRTKTTQDKPAQATVERDETKKNVSVTPNNSVPPKPKMEKVKVTTTGNTPSEK
ncbi:MAG: hypothetical protein IKM85_08290 [Bacteroidales bacterium]|nr:hypothetical protein [Bacteroidales bacterium]